MKLLTNLRLLPLLSFAFICLFVVACSDDDPNSNEGGGDVETTVEEDKANIQTTLDNMLVCVEDMTSSRAIDVILRDFFNVSDGEAYNESWADDLSGNFDNIFDFEHIDETGRFNMDHHNGRYFYDHTTSAWKKVGTTPGLVVVQFPSSPEATENNVNLIIDSYVDQEITLDGEQIFAPSLLHASVHVDNDKIFELSLDKVNYDDNSTFEIPVEIDATLFMTPMFISVDVARISSTEFSGKLEFNDGSSCNMSLEAELELADDDFENLTEESIEKIHAKVRIGDLTIQSLAGLADLIGEEEPDASLINDMLDLDVLFSDLKIADLEYDEVEENFVIHYKDSSTESAANYIDGFLEDMEAMIEEFTGEW